EVIGRALNRSLVAVILIALVAGGIYWWVTRPKEVAVKPPVETITPKTQRPENAAIPKVPFADVTKAVGIDFVHESGAEGEKLLPETRGSACAFFDYDNDGDQDLLLVNSNRWAWDKREKAPPATPALYQNDGKGNFTNVTKGSGLDISFYG